MEKKIIEVPHKTFVSYEQGKRTFIHLLKERLGEFTDLEYGQEVTLKDHQTGELLEQNFWFLYSFKEVERFIFLVFKWDKTDSLFRKRKLVVANEILDVYHNTITAYSNCELHLVSQMHAYSSFFFISDEFIFGTIHFNTKYGARTRHNRDQKEDFILVDTLKIKNNDGKILYVNSFFPTQLLHV